MNDREMTYDAYIEDERRNSGISLQHDYVQGRTYPIFRSPEHTALARDVYTRLRRGLPVEAFKVHEGSCRFFFRPERRTIHPDVVVTRGHAEAPSQDPDAIANPLTIVDVVDEANMTSARGYRWDLYQQFETLREYVLVHEDSPLVEVFSRENAGAGDWKHQTYGAGRRIELASLELSIDVAPRLAVHPWFRA